MPHGSLQMGFKLSAPAASAAAAHVAAAAAAAVGPVPAAAAAVGPVPAAAAVGAVSLAAETRGRGAAARRVRHHRAGAVAGRPEVGERPSMDWYNGVSIADSSMGFCQ